MAISMDGRGRALDNVFVERLWRTVKYEEVYLKEYENAWQAETSLREVRLSFTVTIAGTKGSTSHAGQCLQTQRPTKDARGRAVQAAAGGQAPRCRIAAMTRGQQPQKFKKIRRPRGGRRHNERTTQTAPLTLYRYSPFSWYKEQVRFSLQTGAGQACFPCCPAPACRERSCCGEELSIL